jgi:hypothetical protein
VSPQHLIDWKGHDWTRVRRARRAPELAVLHPDVAVPDAGPEWDDPQGVPISAILFGGRRKTTVPLVTEARDWQHGVFIGATLGSEKTAAAEGKVGTVRRDPMAMLPFIGYNVGDYCQHWLNIGKNADESKLPKIFFVNWFRRGDDGRFLWPGFGENSRVLKWIVERMEGKANGASTPIGTVPGVDDLDLSGLDVEADDVEAAVRVNASEWRDELPQIEEWFEFIGEKLPTGVKDEFEALKQRLARSRLASGRRGPASRSTAARETVRSALTSISAQPPKPPDPHFTGLICSGPVEKGAGDGRSAFQAGVAGCGRRHSGRRGAERVWFLDAHRVDDDGHRAGRGADHGAVPT